MNKKRSRPRGSGGTGTLTRTAAVQPVLRGGRPVNLNFGEEENGASISP